MNNSFVTHHCRVYYPYHHYHASTRDNGQFLRFKQNGSFRRLNVLTFTTGEKKKNINTEVPKHISIAMLFRRMVQTSCKVIINHNTRQRLARHVIAKNTSVNLSGGSGWWRSIQYPRAAVGTWTQWTSFLLFPLFSKVLLHRERALAYSNKNSNWDWCRSATGQSNFLIDVL